MFEGSQDEVKENVDESRLYVDDVVALIECHVMGDFDVGAIISVVTSTIVGYIRDFNRKKIVRIGVCLTAGIVAVEGGIDSNVQVIHLLGDGALVCLGTLAQVLQEIVENKKVGGTWVVFDKARCIVAAGVSA